MTRYEQGFIKRASELGYDGASLLKEARRAIPKTGLDKVRSLAREYFGHISGKNVRKARAGLDKVDSAIRRNSDFSRKYYNLLNKRDAEFLAKRESLYNRVPNGFVQSSVRGNHAPVSLPTYKLVAKQGLPDSMWIDAEKARAARDAVNNHFTRLATEYNDVLKPAREAAESRLSEAIQHRKNAITGTAVGAADIIGGLGLGALLAKPYNDSRKKK